MDILKLKEHLRKMCRHQDLNKVVLIVEDAGEGEPLYGEHRFKAHFFTACNDYQIVAIERHGKGEKSYLGCQVSRRMPRAGEDWTRGNDLADGDLADDTWDRIKGDIISYELIPLAPKIEQIEVPIQGVEKVD